MAMNQARMGLLVAAALVAMPVTALAQPKGAPKAQAGKKGDGKPAGKDGKPAGKDDKPKEINLDEPGDAAPKEGTEGPTGPEANAGTPGGEGEGLGDICKIDPTACPTIDMEKAAARK